MRRTTMTVVAANATGADNGDLYDVGGDLVKRRRKNTATIGAMHQSSDGNTNNNSATIRCGRRGFCGGGGMLPALLVLAVSSLLVIAANAGWVDPDTPIEEHTTAPLTERDDRRYKLVFSDEFEEDGRQFHDGTDPRWTAINKNDYTNLALHYYSHDNARTGNGVLNITTEFKKNYYRAFDEEKKYFYTDAKHVQSGMLQGWNKFCFIGGIVEFSATLPGDPSIGGLWPAMWMLGNLARATYIGSTNYIWPWSYNKCNADTRHSQEINACKQVNHYGLHPFQGRGSPEIDILESMQGDGDKLPSTHIRRPYQSASLQVSPGIDVDRPILGKRPHRNNWYQHLEYGNETNADINPFFYGVKLVHDLRSQTYQSDAISANMQLNTTHYRKMHRYRVEWDPPEADGKGGYVKWFTDDKLVAGVFGDSLGIMETEIPSEPMYMLMNTAVSSSWGFPVCDATTCGCKCFECGDPDCLCALPHGYCENFPAFFEIDYVRVYQAVNDSKHMLGCSPPHRPTETWIQGHADRYTSEGQSVPLLPVRTGGGVCTSSKDCGSHNKGICASDRTCKCSKGWTGPHCRSHAAFYEFETTIEKPAFKMSSMVLPTSLILLFAALMIGFTAYLIKAAKARATETKYIRMPPGSTSRSGDGGTSYSGMGGVNSGFQPPHATTSSPYQQPAADHYAIPAKQKEVTYCVIDGRLVDS